MGYCITFLQLVSAQAAQPSGHQHHAEAAPGYARQAASYRLPQTTLVRSDGVKTNFLDEIDDGKPVILNFIYTTCTAICPILSQSFAGFQRGLGVERNKVHMVSISIDPEEDTPARLANYARRLDAGEQWRFYTGSVQASITLQKAFQVYFGNKMHHRPVTFMRLAPGQAWVRLDGFTTPDDLLKEYRALVVAR
jgi:protein SCO1/2